MRAIVTGLLLLFAMGCARGTPAYSPKIDAATFSAKVTNPFFPLVPGSVLHYEGKADGETSSTDMTVTKEKKTINGIPVVVVHDVDKDDEGHTIEDTIDYYSQDDRGNVWYIGEDTVSYEDGRPDRRGTWRYGSNGAKPGIAMKARPKKGDRYRQEYRPGRAEDEAKVTRVAGDVVVTQEFTRLEPGNVEEKMYRRGVGLVALRSIKGEREESHLVSVKKA